MKTVETMEDLIGPVPELTEREKSFARTVLKEKVLEYLLNNQNSQLSKRDIAARFCRFRTAFIDTALAELTKEGKIAERLIPWTHLVIL
jgi:hypothetical protein